MELSKFEELEEKLNQLLKGCESLEGENRKLRDLLGGKGEEIKGLKKRIERLNREKGQVREKVESLLSRLNSMIQKA
jgi:chromosome segregation ATPase